MGGMIGSGKREMANRGSLLLMTADTRSSLFEVIE